MYNLRSVTMQLGMKVNSPHAKLLFLLCLNLLALTALADSYNITISAVTTPSSCHANGALQVKLGGSDTANFVFRSYSVAGNGNTYTGANPTFSNLSKGAYSVTVSGEVNGEYVTRSTNATVSGSYVVPSASKVVGADYSQYGTRKTFSCRNTGKVQLQIKDGTFPYVVETSLSGTLVKRDTFKTRQSTNPYSQDYDYYSIGDLAEGFYTFRVIDGCEYVMPEITESVETLTSDFECSKVEQYRTSINNNDNNVVAIRLLPILSNDELYKYRYEHDNRTSVWWEYSLSYDGGAYTAWKDIPQSEIIYDTVKSATKYCDIWGKSYTIKTRVKGCATESCSQAVTVSKPDFSFITSVSRDEYTGCIADTLLTCYNSDYYYTTYTKPLHVQLTDTKTGQVICDSVLADSSTEIDVKITQALHNQILHLLVTDKNGCVITDKEQMLYLSTYGGKWYRNGNSYPCELHSVEIWTSDNIVRGTAVELISSPNSNSLNFKATYDKDNDTWSAIKSNAATRSDVISTIYNGFALSDTTLPSGLYKWVFTDDCGRNDTVTDDFTFYQYEVADSLHFTRRTDCEGMMYFPKGKVVRRIDGTGAAIEEAAVSFRVSGPSGGYRISNGKSEGTLNSDSLLISAAGTYIVRMGYDMYSSCADADTIVYSPINAALKDALGYVCLSAGGAPSSSGKIIAKVDSSTGVAPYTFTLYAQPNAAGAVLETNQTGLFANAGQADDELSLRISDNCNASFIQNVTIQGVYEAGTKKIFGANRVGTGASLSLHGLPIGSGSIVTYRWSGPNGFSATGKDIVVADSATAQHSGRYYLDILGLECTLKDSIDVAVASCIEQNVIDSLSICSSQLPYAYRDTLFEVETTGGTFVFRRSTAQGCDSIVTLRLSVHPTYSRTDSVAICSHDLPYTYGDTTFAVGSLSGVYHISLKTKKGCDSLVSLKLTVNEGVKFSAVSPGICADQAELPIEYRLEQGVPTTYSLYFEQGQHFFTNITDAPLSDGDLASSRLHISVPAGVKPNIYKAELALSNGNCISQRQPLSIGVSYPSTVIAQKWNDVIATYSRAYNGGYDFAAFQWYKNGEEIPNATRPTLYITPSLDFGAAYHVRLTRTDGVTLPCCPIVPQQRAESSVYPTLVRQGGSISVYGVEQGEAVIRNLLGIPITEKQAIGKDVKNTIQAPAAAGGIYFLELRYTDGGRHVIPIHIQ